MSVPGCMLSTRHSGLLLWARDNSTAAQHQLLTTYLLVDVIAVNTLCSVHILTCDERGLL